VPGSTGKIVEFMVEMQEVLERPPTSDFNVPIVVEPKVGTKFGELSDVDVSHVGMLEGWRY